MTHHQYLHLTHQIAALESRMRFDFRIIGILMLLSVVMTVCFIRATDR